MFDFLSGKDEAEEAAAKNAALYAGYGVDTSNLFKGYKEDATNALTGAKTAALGKLGQGLTDTLNPLYQGLTGSVAAGNAGVAAFNPLSDLGKNYGGAVNRYYDTLGLNGPDAARAAQAGYVADPGQQYQLDEAQRAAMNAASRTGSVGGGSTAQGIARDALGIVNKNYGAYQDRLAQFAPLQLSATGQAATGVAGANKTLADIYNQGYGAIGAANQQNATQQAALESGFGSDIANVLGNYTTGQGQSLKDIVAGNAAGNNSIAAQGAADASNTWGAIGAALGAAGKVASGGFGAGGAWGQPKA